MPSFLPRLEHYSASIDLMHENGFSASSKEKKFSKANDTCGRIHWNRILKRWGAVVHLTLAETSRPWSFRGRSNTKLVRPLFCRSLTAEWANLLSMKRAESIFAKVDETRREGCSLARTWNCFARNTITAWTVIRPWNRRRFARFSAR